MVTTTRPAHRRKSAARIPATPAVPPPVHLAATAVALVLCTLMLSAAAIALAVIRHPLVVPAVVLLAGCAGLSLPRLEALVHTHKRSLLGAIGTAGVATIALALAVNPTGQRLLVVAGAAGVSYLLTAASALWFTRRFAALGAAHRRALEEATADSALSSDISDLVVDDAELIVIVTHTDGRLIYTSPYTQTKLDLPEDPRHLGIHDVITLAEYSSDQTDTAESADTASAARPATLYRAVSDFAPAEHLAMRRHVLEDRGVVVYTGRDTTADRSRLEAQIEAAVSAQRAHDALTRANDVKHDLVSVVSHELRTPVTSILGYAELIEGEVFGDLPAGAVDAAAVISRNGRRLLDLIDDLLDLNRREEPDSTLGPPLVNIAEGLEHALAALDPIAAARGVTLVRHNIEPVNARLHPDKFERVVLNLLSNAIKFTPERGKVTVSLTSSGSYATRRLSLSVADTGMGISAADQASIFTPFFRGQPAKDQAVQGVGLGLAIVADIVADMHGTIDLASTPGKGTTFTVTIPIPDRDTPSAAPRMRLGSLHTTQV